VTDVLLVGRNGQLGHELERLLSGRFTVMALSSADLDISDPDATRAAIRRFRPVLIVNTAAYTAVDRAESEQEAAFAVNARAPEAMVQAAATTGSALLHFSTDFVFDGLKREPYTENDAIGPLNVYGASKLAGEEAIRASDVPHMIFRTSWLYATRGSNFLLTISRLLRERDSLSVVNDQTGSPTWVRELARLVSGVLPRRADELRSFVAANNGLYHLGCEGAVTWYDFAVRIREHWLTRGEKPCEIKPIPSTDYKTAAIRPAYSVLDKAKFRLRFGRTPMNWDAALAEAFSTLPA
jgi:dTDP-4-dehydrorhamnose reductase